MCASSEQAWNVQKVRTGTLLVVLNLMVLLDQQSRVNCSCFSRCFSRVLHQWLNQHMNIGQDWMEVGVEVRVVHVVPWG